MDNGFYITLNQFVRTYTINKWISSNVYCHHSVEKCKTGCEEEREKNNNKTKKKKKRKKFRGLSKYENKY